MAVDVGGEAPRALAVMWTLTAVTLVFTTLRLYTRIYVNQQLGMDDQVYVLAAILLLLYTVFINVASRFGFGQPISVLDIDDMVQAIKWEMFGQTFAVVGMAVAKISLGLFLLRVVVESWHRIAIWVVMAFLMVSSLLTAVPFWFQCVPAAAIFDPRVRAQPGTRCDVSIAPFAVELGVACIIADFFFAIFPTLFVWNLNMEKKEKITIAGSTSLDVIAGAAGIVRTYEVAIGFTTNYTEDTVGLIVWSAVEMAVTMICIGIPVLRPLYRRIVHGSNFSSGRQYHQPDQDNNRRGYELGAAGARSGFKLGFGGGGDDSGSILNRLGIKTTTVTRIGATKDNQSDDYILGNESMRGGASAPGTIRVQDELKVEWHDK